MRSLWLTSVHHLHGCFHLFRLLSETSGHAPTVLGLDLPVSTVTIVTCLQARQ